MSVTVDNTTASLSGKTLLKAEDAQTITGAKTFDLGASAPFVVVSGAAKVANLDADKLDGQTGADYHDASLLTGVLPVTVVGVDPNADRIVFWDDSAGAYAFLTPSTPISGTTIQLPFAAPCGRLSLTTAEPITTSDVLAATTLYWALYEGNMAQIYNGSAWQNFVLAQLSIAVPATTATMYDVFLDYNSGTPALSLTAWSNVTTRATALVKQDGVYVLSGTATKRYVGSFCTTAVSGQTEDSAANRLVYNYYHRVPRRLQLFESTATWNYTLATFRQARATATNKVSCVVGVLEDMIHLVVQAFADNAASAVRIAVAIGEDSTTTQAAGQLGMGSQINNVGAGNLAIATLDKYPSSVGYHDYNWLESSEAAGTTAWRSGINSPYFAQSGISGWIEG